MLNNLLNGEFKTKNAGANVNEDFRRSKPSKPANFAPQNSSFPQHHLAQRKVRILSL